MACAKWEDLLAIVKLQIVPPEVCSGTLFYYWSSSEICHFPEEVYVSVVSSCFSEFIDNFANITCQEVQSKDEQIMKVHVNNHGESPKQELPYIKFFTLTFV